MATVIREQAFPRGLWRRWSGKDPADRQRFNAMPTTFHLQPDQVDALRVLAGRLLTQTPEFRNFLRELREEKHAPVHAHATTATAPVDVQRR